MSVNDPMMESKHHDPMLDGITRYTFDDVTAGPLKYRATEFIDVSDLPALLARTREDERGKRRYSENEMNYQTERYHKVGYEQGQRDEREACIAAVEALYSTPSLDRDPTPLDFLIYEEVIPAIRARGES